MRNKPHNLIGAATLLSAAVVVLQAAVTYSGVTTSVPPREIPNLNAVGEQIGSWNSDASVALDPEVVDRLQPDTYIQRRYKGPDVSQSVDVFVAYFKSLKNNAGPHSPAVCLPGSGWLTKSNSVITVAVPSGNIPVNEYWLTKGPQQTLVHYWYQNRRNAWAHEVMAKLYLLPDMIRYRRSDVALVRLSTAVDGSSPGPAREALQQFSALIFPVLHNQMPE